MFVSIGKRATPQDLVGLLLDCHERIRTFMRLAQEVGRRTDLAPDDVVQACRRFEHYFAYGLPKHVADEDKSLLPRLRGTSHEVDAALTAMHAQHDEHAPLLEELLAAAAALRATPVDPVARARVAAAAARLAPAIDEHLRLEEQVIFPAARHHLPDEVQAQVLLELRRRRRD